MTPHDQLVKKAADAIREVHGDTSVSARQTRESLRHLAGELDIQREISRENWDAVVDDQTQLRPELAKKGLGGK